MRIDDIDALLATVQFSSLNQAAEYLGITQSAITRRLQRLEQTLGVTLLERQTRPLTLTAAGHRVYEQCLSIKRETKSCTGCWIRRPNRTVFCASAYRRAWRKLRFSRRCWRYASSFHSSSRRSPAAGAGCCKSGSRASS